jgi:hypothetical protein
MTQGALFVGPSSAVLTLRISLQAICWSWLWVVPLDTLAWARRGGSKNGLVLTRLAFRRSSGCTGHTVRVTWLAVVCLTIRIKRILADTLVRLNVK